MSVPVRDFLNNRRNRAVGSILGYVEREIFPKLSAQEQRELRLSVLDALNSYHDSVLDLVKAEDGVRNDVVVEAIRRLEERITAQQRAVRASARLG